ncbi:MAG: DUF4342 domain-containing protein [Spirochaetales bacterium]|nr:DUF4342 domain-containing protein [Spirochaetales bacterium]
MAEQGAKEGKKAGMKEEFSVKGEDLVRRVRELVHEGTVRRIIIKDDQGKTYFEVPLTIGVVGALLVPVWAAIGAVAALASNFTIEIIKKEE